ncbi:Sec-independent protein translocase protein TatB [Celerinatantimonas diazotrophica]|uniref:Sec-independent protein translocase protein TatB n=1 Tax=Celerinatantimonas diazotrophica TaxID=412034 RepID=A0A4R1KGT3_9GAMM|nr:Sec-independent protein translocase protein TatB [Celerinatantimonas diazotrophica]TCK63360.1 Sec-independent protein translocase TatB [Celerinatantimonas diazotrophica]CAG9294904.1 Sec-independent protein translocase protein TatB [Celerinatantimonas diazotrophica]
MFDIGFWELVLCAVIGLIVLGPERLPKAIRALMRWVYMLRSMANQVKDDLEKEIQLKELREEVEKARQAGYTIGGQLKDSLNPQDIHPQDTPTSVSPDSQEAKELTPKDSDEPRS